MTGIDVDDIMRRLKSNQSRSLIAEELLDILLTTYNYSLVVPETGGEIVRRFISRELDSLETLQMLVSLSLSVEPEKTLKLLKSYSLVSEP